MDPDTQSENLKKPKILATSKRPKNKRKEKQLNFLEKPIYHLPSEDNIPAQQDTTKQTNTELEAKRQKLDKKELQNTNITPQRKHLKLLKKPSKTIQKQPNTEGHPEYQE